MTTYRTQGVCSRSIDFDVVDGKVRNVCFNGGCSGNARGISALVEGMDADEVVEKLRGTRCGNRPTSCPDQLARALEAR